MNTSNQLTPHTPAKSVPSVAGTFHSLCWKGQKRRLMTVTAGLILASSLLYLWLPFRVGAVQLFIQMGGSRVFIGTEYSSLDAPRYISYDPTSSIEGYSSDTEVIGLEFNGVAKAIPVKRIAWYMVFNDEIGGEPVVVTLCTVADAAMAFWADHGGRKLHFRPIGLQRNNLVLMDTETQSRWQQFTGKAILGSLAGAELRRIPLERLSLEAWRRLHPRGSILEPLRNVEDTTTPHDTCPVMCYFPSEPFLLQKPEVEDERLPRKQSVLGMVAANGEDLALPLRGETKPGATVLPGNIQAIQKVKCYWFAWAEFHPGSRIFNAGNERGPEPRK